MPPVKKCSCCPSPQYHCPFCGAGVFKPTNLSMLKIHLSGHIKKAIAYGDYTIHRCGLSCRKRQHFHCLYCTTTVLRKRDLKVHFSCCHIKHTQTPPTSDQGSNPFSLPLVQSFEMPAQTLSPATSVHTPSPVTSVQDTRLVLCAEGPSPTKPVLGPNPTSFSPTLSTLACSMKSEEVPLRLNETLPYTLPQDPLIQKCKKQPSKVKPCFSPDLVGDFVKENQIKMEAQDHDYSYNLVDAEMEENKVRFFYHVFHFVCFFCTYAIVLCNVFLLL
ncbi:hypothetical protein ATANTOWER_023800 [Ataeniobius toweri]|uniref:C2H2-type domain-containing protein n=1 Tax=Ataeniobius toweri TaxID=208326 RepID=A0ABU7BUE2_9TELE|nr:hypothetical protein [Ataeniobius toweri]